MAKITTINVEVEPSMKRALIRKATESKVKLSVIVRWALDAYLEANPPKEQVA